MKIESKIETTIKLILNKEEALWLKNYLQNGFPEENNENKIMRETFWHLLDSEV